MARSDDRPDSASLERIVPDELVANEATGAETLGFHVERYLFARNNLKAGSVLDIACGVGYGTPLLAQKPQITNAVGVDISAASVRHALQRYSSERVSYICCDALQFFPSQKFDNIVSLETVEHMDDPRVFLSHLVPVLQAGGHLIASVPVTPSVDANPHHKSNFSSRSFLRMGEALGLEYVTSLNQVQQFSPASIVMREEARAGDLRRNLPVFYLRNPSHLALRLWSTLSDGFVNKYLTVVWRRPTGSKICSELSR